MKDCRKYFDSGCTILVCDSYYLDVAELSILRDADPPVAYICAMQADRFKLLDEMIADTLDKPGQWELLQNSEFNELMVCYWNSNPSLGKQYTISNTLYQTPQNDHPLLIPVYDTYAVMMHSCDLYNRELNSRTWPHRHGGGEVMGEHGKLNDFAFSAILQNTYNAYINVNKISSSTLSYRTFCEELSQEIYGNIVNN